MPTYFSNVPFAVNEPARKSRRIDPEPEIHVEDENTPNEYGVLPMLRVSGDERVFRYMHIMEVIRLMETDGGAQGQLAKDFICRVCRESTIRNGLYENSATVRPHQGLELILIKLGELITDLTVNYTGCTVLQIRNIASLVNKHCRMLVHYRIRLYNKTPRHATSAYNIPELSNCQTIEVRDCEDIHAPSNACFRFTNDRLLSRLVMVAPNLLDLHLYDLTVHGWFLATLPSRIRQLKMVNLKRLVGVQKVDFNMRHITETTSNLNINVMMEMPSITSFYEIDSSSFCAKKLHLRIASIDSTMMNRLLMDIIVKNQVRDLRLDAPNSDLYISNETAQAFKHFTRLRTLHVDKSIAPSFNWLQRFKFAPNLKQITCDYWTALRPREFANNVTSMFHINPQLGSVVLDFPPIDADTTELVLRILEDICQDMLTFQMREKLGHRSILIERFNRSNDRRNRIRNSIIRNNDLVRNQIDSALESRDIVFREHAANVEESVNEYAQNTQPSYVRTTSTNVSRSTVRRRHANAHPNVAIHARRTRRVLLNVDTSDSDDQDVVVSRLNPNARPYRPHNPYFKHPTQRGRNQAIMSHSCNEEKFRSSIEDANVMHELVTFLIRTGSWPSIEEAVKLFERKIRERGDDFRLAPIKMTLNFDAANIANEYFLDYLVTEPCAFVRLLNRTIHMVAATYLDKSDVTFSVRIEQIHALARCKNLPRIEQYNLVGGPHVLRKGLSNFSGILTGLSDIKKTIRHAVWYCPRLCPINIITGQPRKPMRCEECQGELFEYTRYRDMSEYICLEMMPIESVRNRSREDWIYRSTICRVDDEMALKNFTLGQQYHMSGIYDGIAQQFIVWDIAAMN